MFFALPGAVILSLVFFDRQIIGTREGTVISALFTGIAVKLITKYIRNYVDKITKYKL